MLSIGLDIGSTNIKCSLVDIESKQVYFNHTIAPYIKTSIEMDPLSVLDCVLTLVKGMAKEFSASALNTISSIGVTGQMHGLLILTSEGDPLTPFITWQDERALLFVNYFRPRTSPNNLTNRPGMMASLLPWYLQRDLDWPKGWRISNIIDFVVEKLSGKKAVTDISSAAASGLWRSHKFPSYAQINSPTL